MVSFERLQDIAKEASNRIDKMSEDDLADHADGNCKKCFGIGRLAYRYHRGKRKIIICNCIAKNVKKDVEGWMDAKSSE